MNTLKNMDIETFAMLLAMDRKRSIEDALAALGINYKLVEDFVFKDASAFVKYLESERGE